MSKFGRLIDQRQIKKRVDAMPVDAPAVAAAQAARQADVKPTEIAVLAREAQAFAGEARRTIGSIISRVEAENAGDEVFEAYFKAVRLMNPDPMEGGRRVDPPTELFRIVARDVYRRQTDPRTILAADLYRAKAQAGAVEYAAPAYVDASGANPLYDGVPNRSMPALVVAKDRQFVQLALAHAQEVDRLLGTKTDGRFAEGLAEMAAMAGGGAQRLGNQIQHLGLLSVDSLFSEFETLEGALDLALGGMLDFARLKKRLACDFGRAFGITDNVLAMTDNLERLSDAVSGVPSLHKFKKRLDKELHKALAEVEKGLLSVEGKVVQSHEARQLELDNARDLAIVKDGLLAAQAMFGGQDWLANLKTDPMDTIRQFEAYYRAIESAIDAGKAFERRMRPGKKEKEAAEQMSVVLDQGQQAA